MSGPLSGVRVIELAGIGPGPHAAMILADMGADVVRVDRPRSPSAARKDVDDHVLRGRTIITADLKNEVDRDEVLRLIDSADVVLEGFRPGVVERLGVGPVTCLQRNPGLVYTRITGWGQDGPLARTAGHDINYISLTGALHSIGTEHEPTVPVNFLGDYGGGSMFAVAGTLAALLERATSGKGQVVDAAIVDGTATLTQLLWSKRDAGEWIDRRESNLLDGHAPFYRTYRCADGTHVAVGALEPQFYAALLAGLGLSEDVLGPQMDETLWPSQQKVIEETIAGRNRDEWSTIFDGTDACVSPVLSLAEVCDNEHIRARGSVKTDRAGRTAASPSPRFSRTVNPTPDAAVLLEPSDVLARWNV
ncbi:carnitine dehydratase [Rhodococcus sp. 15-1154-1]|nr:CaiB/BaiF CoA-transferase family protein [Rhodococcus sp. 15-1154-1]OZF02515.1 carnitine dehydratase [Rhodococcus sp. 15-1154-1]